MPQDSWEDSEFADAKLPPLKKDSIWAQDEPSPPESDGAAKPCSIRVPSELQDAGGDLEPGSYFISKVGNMDLLQL